MLEKSELINIDLLELCVGQRDQKSSPFNRKANQSRMQPGSPEKEINRNQCPRVIKNAWADSISSGDMSWDRASQVIRHFEESFCVPLTVSRNRPLTATDDIRHAS
jgi:hypothetical protein